MAISIDLQNESSLQSVPDISEFSQWVTASLQHSHTTLEQTIRIVDEAEAQQLNSDYRGKDLPTNVLAFPAEVQWLDYDCLGDLVICAPVVALEAKEQGKSLDAHWAHLVVHGMLHLQGFDHQNPRECREMESEEIKNS